MHVGIIGGSLGGLQTGIELLSIGLDVNIYERSNHEPKDRGAGIVLHKRVIDHLHERKLGSVEKIGVFAKKRVFYSIKDKPVEVPAKVYATSWKSLFNCYYNSFPTSRYHQNSEFVSAETKGEKVEVLFKDGQKKSFDFVVFADGGDSLARKILQPDIIHTYSGHVAWRGLIEEKRANVILDKFVDQITIFYGKSTHILCYLVPNEQLSNQKGQRLLNWVWYRRYSDSTLKKLLTDKAGNQKKFSIPKGQVPHEVIHELRDIAKKELTDPFLELVQLTDQPFIQPVYDVIPNQVAFERSVLLGDAGFLARPHATASTYKSLVEAESLRESLSGSTSLREALSNWQSERKKFGEEIVRKSKEMGNLDRYIKPKTSSF